GWLMAEKNQQLSVMASDAKADIYVDGQYVGRGTATTSVRRGEVHAVMARVGDRTGAVSVGRKISGAGIFDIVTCVFGVPCLGFLGAGFWQVYPSSVVITLPPETAARR